jgi:hypothetical protein
MSREIYSTNTLWEPIVGYGTTATATDGSIVADALVQG